MSQIKNELRKEAIKKRLDMCKNGMTNCISNIIVQKILNSNDFKNAKNIALYYPVKGEVNLLEILKSKNKNFFFPKCLDNDIEFIKYSNEFKKDKYNIPIPTGEAINPDELDIIYTPALEANSNKYRLGYGKGYYDKFFSKRNLKAKKIIVLSKEFINNEFKQDEFDIQYDDIITEN